MSEYGKRIYFHVTQKATALKIMSSNGIDVAFCRGRRKVCWYVRFEQVSWAVAHVMAKRGCHLAGMVVLKCHISDRWMHQQGATQLFWTKHTVMPVEMIDAATFILREEARLLKMALLDDNEKFYDHLK